MPRRAVTSGRLSRQLRRARLGRGAKRAVWSVRAAQTNVSCRIVHHGLATLGAVSRARPVLPRFWFGDEQRGGSFSVWDLLPSFCGFALGARGIAGVAKRLRRRIRG